MTDKNNYRYIDVLDDVVNGHNNTIHSTTGFLAATVTAETVGEIPARMPDGESSKKSPQFKVGDKVRVSTSKLAF